MRDGLSFKLYPRGFLGAVLGRRLEKVPKPFGAELNAHQFHTDVFKSQNTIDDANPNVVALYSKYIKDMGETTSFDFRKQILFVALRAFGTMQFDLWFQQQHKSPATGDLHRRFLDDTLKFIREGRREVCLENWNALLTLSDTGSNVTALSQDAHEFFGISSGGINRYRQNCDLVDVLQMWCAQPGGIEDLLGTLHVLFGTIEL